MFWINPYSQRNQRHRWTGPLEEAKAQEAAERQALQREIVELRREWVELKREIAARSAAKLREAEALRRKSDLAWDQFFRTFKRHAEQQKAGFNLGQPRAPKGSPDGGQWSSGSGDGEQARRIRLAGDITGFTKHGIDQAITRGVSPSSMHDAVVNPIQILPQANGTTRYIGRGAVVVLNPLGQVVTTWGQ